MGKSFVLKDVSGRPMGYLMQAGDAVRYRISAAYAADVTLLFEDGAVYEHSVVAHSSEKSWTHGGRSLLGGYICREGEVILATDERIRRCAWMMKAPGSVQRKEDAQEGEQAEAKEQKTVLPDALEDDPKDDQAEEALRILPDRRWPPPPCLTSVVYLHGQWVQMQ
ncbi:MAG: hypothetical protein IJB85_01680 [Clostridia bacterium]|nr:hypothetical protein [Clostridia bacterium]